VETIPPTFARAGRVSDRGRRARVGIDDPTRKVGQTVEIVVLMTSASPPQSEVPDKYEVMRDVWNDYNRRQDVEHELIDRKTTWLLTGESLLFTAYGVTLGLSDNETPEHLMKIADKFRGGVAWAGLLIAAAMLVGLTTIIISKWASWRRYLTMYEKRDPDLPKPFTGTSLTWGPYTKNTLVSVSADLAVPIVFLGIWIYVILVT
jgi:hypothetical protein